MIRGLDSLLYKVAVEQDLSALAPPGQRDNEEVRLTPAIDSGVVVEHLRRLLDLADEPLRDRLVVVDHGQNERSGVSGNQKHFPKPDGIRVYNAVVPGCQRALSLEQQLGHL